MPQGAESVVHPTPRRWRARYERAARLLDDVAYLMTLRRIIARIDLAGLPRAICLVGKARLSRARRVGLFPGSFNPLTLAHVELAEAARRRADLDLVVWASAAVTVDKERVGRAALADRLAQLAAYARAHRGGAVALLNRGLYVDEAEALRREMAPGAELLLLMGFDKVAQVFAPRYYDDRAIALRDLFARARLLAAPRAGAGERELAELLARPENRPYADGVASVVVPSEYARDSSTEARWRAAQGQSAGTSLRTLVPPEGFALADTGAYAPAGAAGDDIYDDTYALRQSWLAALSPLPRAALRHLPPLTLLVRATGAVGRQSDALRGWLAAGDDEQTAARLRAALADAGISPPASPG